MGIELWLWKFLLLACTEWPKAVAAAEFAVLSRISDLLEGHSVGCHDVNEVDAAGPTINHTSNY